MDKIKVNGKLYFYCSKCRRKFMFEHTRDEHKCETDDWSGLRILDR